MLIDPFTTLAQIVNFLILVALLKHFLYGPITRAMNQREQTIAERLQWAEQKEATAEQEAARLQQMQRDFATHREQRLAELRSHLEEQRLTLLEQTEDEVEAARDRWYRALAREKNSVLRSLRQQTAYQLLQTLRQVLADLANASLEQQVVEVFLTRLRQLPAAEQQRLRAALARADDAPVVVGSSFDLPEVAQQTLTDVLQAIAQRPVPALTFEVDPALNCGLELRAPGYKLAWSLTAYLEALEQRLAAALDEQAREAPPTPVSA